MTYLELVNFAIKRSGVREEEASTLVGATGLVQDFANWVADTWYELQLEKQQPPWWFMTSPDQTLALAASTDTYNMPAGLSGIDWRTVSVYTAAKTDETYLCYIPYYEWRMKYDLYTYQEGRPRYITLAPDNTLRVFPVPDQIYTLRFDGVADIVELSADADVPAVLPAQYHRMIAWGAIMRYASHHEDGAMLMNAQNKFRPIYDKIIARHIEEVDIETGRLYGTPSPF